MATDSPASVAIALGSNLGDRASHLRFAVERLHPLVQDLRLSTFIDTAPVGVAEQPLFLNGAAAGTTRLGARDLLNALLSIERERGRERPFQGAPRTLDLDLVLYGDSIISEPGLSVPHPRFRERAFVLAPLAEIGAEMRDPVTGLTVAQLWERLHAATIHG